MKATHLGFLLGLLIFGVGASVGQAATWNDCGEQINMTTSQSGLAISVDSDATIWLTGSGNRRKVGQDLQAKMSEKPEVEFVPRSDILVGRQQLTCKSKNWRLVALTMVHLTTKDGIQLLENRMIVVLFRGSVARVLLCKLYPEIISLALADVNGDGMPELAIEWSDAALISPASWLDVWRIDIDGHVAPVNLANITDEMNLQFASHASRIELGNYQSGNFSVTSEQKLIKKNATVLRVQKEYVWNREKEAYVFKSKVEIEERVLTTQ